jgi:hypothetical protein
MPTFTATAQAPVADRTVISYQQGYSAPQPETVINYPIVSMTYSVDYRYYHVEPYQAMPGPSAGPSRSLETPPS